MAAAVAIALATLQNPSSLLRLVGTIPMDGVQGRIDHLAVDADTGRVFVAALGNNTLESTSLRTATHATLLTGLREPQGVAFSARANRLVVANGGDGTVDFFDATSLARVAHVPLGGDADNVRIDSQGRVFVGYGAGAIAELKTDGSIVARTELGGHPESFQIHEGRSRIFVNVPARGHIAVVDRATHVVVATWPVTRASANYPMALDPEHGRLLVGCRRPARLLVYDIDSGAQVAELPTVGDADDLFYDSLRRQVYVIGGEGAVDVIAQTTPDQYASKGRVETAAGARTGLFGAGRFLVARPRRGAVSAAILVFEPLP